MVYYFLFKWEVVSQKIISYPVLMLLRNEKVKKLYANRGVDNPEIVGWGVAQGFGVADYVWRDRFYNWVETKWEIKK